MNSLTKSIKETDLANRLVSKILKSFLLLKNRDLLIQPDINLTKEFDCQDLHFKVNVEPYIKDKKQVSITISNNNNIIKLDFNITVKEVYEYSTSVQDAPDWIEQPDQLLTKIPISKLLERD